MKRCASASCAKLASVGPAHRMTGRTRAAWQAERQQLVAPAVAAPQPQEAVSQDAALEEGVELVLEEARQFRAGAGLGVRDEAGRALLHQAVQRGLLGAVALVVERGAHAAAVVPRHAAGVHLGARRLADDQDACLGAGLQHRPRADRQVRCADTARTYRFDQAVECGVDVDARITVVAPASDGGRDLPRGLAAKVSAGARAAQSPGPSTSTYCDED